jgi:hypothetical protein
MDSDRYSPVEVQPTTAAALLDPLPSTKAESHSLTRSIPPTDAPYPTPCRHRHLRLPIIALKNDSQSWLKPPYRTTNDILPRRHNLKPNKRNPNPLPSPKLQHQIRLQHLRRPLRRKFLQRPRTALHAPSRRRPSAQVRQRKCRGRFSRLGERGLVGRGTD